MLADGLTKLAVGAAATGSFALTALMRGARHAIQPGRVGRIAAIAASAATKMPKANATELELAIPIGPSGLQISVSDASQPQIAMIAIVFLLFLLAWSLADRAFISVLRQIVRQIAHSLGDEIVARPEKRNRMISDAVDRPSTASKATQSMVTYTTDRGVLNPRFHPLARDHPGVWDSSGLPLEMELAHLLDNVARAADLRRPHTHNIPQ